ncbi:MAG TPA: hydrogenase expression/formation C-terminal domain-containing protein [Gammaproteobacteria bacterium]|nr:hydrogenase expression/formation C-terminal domain-containing protein [Gammaproteobacteria bacterium]
MNRIDIPVIAGPGSQPVEADGVQLDYPVPSGMMTYAMPQIPEPDEVGGAEQAITLLQELQAKLAGYRVAEPAVVLPLDALGKADVDLIDQVLGNGEVSMKYHGAITARIQEAVLAGVWRVQYLDGNGAVARDVVEIAAIPGLVKETTFSTAAGTLDFSRADIPDDVYNAAPLLTEINDKLPACVRGTEPHVINLSLLPHTHEDIDFLSRTLGSGPVVILSRGYGNCRITSTATRNVWWVQYFNSQETLILNTLEISAVPDVACAAQEDIDDSAQRLLEILEVYR